jgi:hypothetical protein
MLDQNNTPLPPEGELKFQIQAMTKIMERMNFVMGNVCDRLERVEKHGNEAGTSTQDVRMVRADSKPNNGSRTERLGWVDYEDFKEDVDDIGDGGFEDETIAISNVFGSLETDGILGIKLGANSAKEEIFVTSGDMIM